MITPTGLMGEVQVKLNSKGVYSWSIKTVVTDGDTELDVCTRLELMDHQLRQTFPGFAKKGSSKWQPM
jgi:hypothetical protein